MDERKSIINGPKVSLPDGSAMKILEIGIFPLNNVLLKMAKTGNVLSGLTNSSLLSIGQLCDDDCLAVFSKYKLRIYKQGRLILTGTCNWTDGLWDVVLSQCQQSVNVIIRCDKTKYELAEYLHK